MSKRLEIWAIPDCIKNAPLHKKVQQWVQQLNAMNCIQSHILLYQFHSAQNKKPPILLNFQCISMVFLWCA